VRGQAQPGWTAPPGAPEPPSAASVHRLVRGREQAVEIIAALTGLRDADAEPDRQRATVSRRERGRRRPQQALPEHGRREAGAAGQHNEFIATDPGDGIAFSQRRLQALRSVAQDAIAGRVPMAVVHLLEVVDVDDRQQHGSPRLPDLLVEPVGEQGPIGQSGQCVVQCQAAQAQRQRAGVERAGQHLRHQSQADDVGLVPADTRAHGVEPDAAAEARPRPQRNDQYRLDPLANELVVLAAARVGHRRHVLDLAHTVGLELREQPRARVERHVLQGIRLARDTRCHPLVCIALHAGRGVDREYVGTVDAKKTGRPTRESG
jgi:hypothetical protein